ncbi:aminotransferase class V-fold PLP-dependent enzyme [Mycolicibacterium stellerae]|uniref:aminotransferase class V-fold PLP-dependent enzyme n=1 Tax=Mycolicibacterium stellerae TaxID=2358193 RepID=UPI0019D11BE2|nr:aminotransferase class V-fold PLP-dependent enzyme [Mycolicibacterium stellerae]
MTSDGMNIAELRALTPGCQHRNHLNNAGAGLLSAPTIAAMTHQLQLEAQIGGYEAAEAAASQIDETYRAVAELLGASAPEIALFDNSTHAWNAAFYSVPLAAGDRILTGRSEYGSNVLAYLQVSQRTGAEVVVVPDDDSGQLDVAALTDLVDERTKLIGLSWVPTASGLVNPAAEIGRIAQEADALFLLDATQVVGQFPIDVHAVRCDMLTGTGRKFLRGPRGTGFLYAGPRAIDRLEPFVAEIRSATWDGGRSFTWAEGAQRFETWENSYVNIVGLGVAVRQALDLGLAEISTRSSNLGVRLRDGLAAVDGVTVHDLGRERCAIVTAKVAGVASTSVAEALAAQRINVSTTVPDHNQFDIRGVHPLVRLSPHYYNTEDEVDRAIESVATLAR